LAQPLITLTTDFGLNDHYVGTMKGVILNINPSAQIVDICNSVQSFDILDGALTIAQSYQYFATDSIHMVIVDPGVGSARRPLLVTTEKHKFIAPDNGVLSLVFAHEERISVRHITASHYFLQPVSNTFHGRDVFAAVAGWLSKGVSVDKFGDEITDYARFTAPRPKRVSDRELKAIVMKVDKFGNLITNIAVEDIPQLFSENPPAFTLTVGKAEVTQLNSSYSQGTAGAVFAIVGSMGYLEISTNRAFAAQLAGANKGSEVVLTFAEPQFVPNGE
jgi:S-adenosyl-L-methionine hydrolase (adenosine-forming)